MARHAQRHAMRVSAIQASQRDNAPLRHASAYEQMLVKLAADRRTLSDIRSKESKAVKKRELLPSYLPWVAGVLASDGGNQDDIVMTVMLWRLDVGDIPGALEIARYALRHNLTMPGNHTRTAPYMLAEEVGLATLRARDMGETVAVSLLLNVIELTSNADMPDEVRARLHKVTGLTLRDAGQLNDALTHLQRANQLDRGAGVRKDIERLTRELTPKPVAAAVKAPRTTSTKKAPAKKTDSPAKRGRGRPKKVAG